MCQNYLSGRPLLPLCANGRSCWSMISRRPSLAGTRYLHQSSNPCMTPGRSMHRCREAGRPCLPCMRSRGNNLDTKKENHFKKSKLWHNSRICGGKFRDMPGFALFCHQVWSWIFRHSKISRDEEVMCVDMCHWCCRHIGAGGRMRYGGAGKACRYTGSCAGYGRRRLHSFA